MVAELNRAEFTVLINFYFLIVQRRQMKGCVVQSS